MSDQVGPKAFTRKLRKNLPLMTEHAADMPILLHRVLSDASAGKLKLQWQSDELEDLHQTLRENHQNTVSAISGGAMLISGSLLLSLGPSLFLNTALVTTTGVGLGVGGVVLLLRSLLRS